MFQSSVRINVGPNLLIPRTVIMPRLFQSSVRINVGPNRIEAIALAHQSQFQSSVRINVGPNYKMSQQLRERIVVSILRED